MSDADAPLKMPAPGPTGFIQTLNQMGGMTPVLDFYSKEFVEFCATAPGAALDVGAAYGVATLAALEKGGSVFANDLDPRHLKILIERTPVEARARVTLLPGAFPDGIELEAGVLGAVLLGRMLHFLDGPAIDRGFARLYRWLAPGGKVFGLAVTPWIKKLQPFAPIYEARKKAGERWPGIVEDTGRYDPDGVDKVPRAMHFLDPEVVTRSFVEQRFVVERAETYSRPEFAGELALDGRELVGFIARKPASEA